MKIRKRLLKKIEEAVPGTMNQAYSEMVNAAIRERYSLSEELAILRKRDDNPEEFAEYNAYAEQCKQRVKEALK